MLRLSTDGLRQPSLGDFTGFGFPRCIFSFLRQQEIYHTNSTKPSLWLPMMLDHTENQHAFCFVLETLNKNSLKHSSVAHSIGRQPLLTELRFHVTQWGPFGTMVFPSHKGAIDKIFCFKQLLKHFFFSAEIPSFTFFVF